MQHTTLDNKMNRILKKNGGWAVNLGDIKIITSNSIPSGMWYRIDANCIFVRYKRIGTKFKRSLIVAVTEPQMNNRTVAAMIVYIGFDNHTYKVVRRQSAGENRSLIWGNQQFINTYLVLDEV